MHDRLDVPEAIVVERIMLVVLRVHDNPAEGEIELLRVTVPAKPFKPATVRDVLPAAPELRVTVLGLVVTVKSWTVKGTVTVWDRFALEAVIVT